MNIEIQISFDENSIVLQSGDTTKRFANLIGIDKTTNEAISIGKTEQEASTFNPKAWEENKHKFVFEPIYENQKFDPERMGLVTEYLLGSFHNEYRSMKLFDKIIGHVTIPNYESSDTKAKERFEFSVDAWDHVKELAINGKIIFSKGWKYNLAKYSLELGWLLVMLLLFSGSSSFAVWFFRLFDPYFSSFPALNLLLLLPLMFGSIWLNEIVWMLGMQLLFSKRILRRIFDRYQRRKTPSNRFSISRTLADWVLGKYE